jgi:hypothetical protein
VLWRRKRTKLSLFPLNLAALSMYGLNLLSDAPSVLGVAGDFELNITGKIEGDVVKARGAVPNLQAGGIALKLTKRENPPQ